MEWYLDTRVSYNVVLYIGRMIFLTYVSVSYQVLVLIVLGWQLSHLVLASPCSHVLHPARVSHAAWTLYLLHSPHSEQHGGYYQKMLTVC